MNTVGRIALVTVIAAVLFATSAGQATGATYIGSNLSAGGAAYFTCVPSCTIVNSTIAPGDLASGGSTAPASGVVTRWTLRTTAEGSSDDASARLRVITNNAATGSSATVKLANQTGLQEFDTRIPIAVGQRVGIDLIDYSGFPAVVGYGTDTGNHMEQWSPVLPESGTGGTSSASSFHLPLQARIEPDADGDGYGDETQDGCPTNAATAGPCPPPVPETTITNAPSKVKGKRAKIEFSSDAAGAIFECALDKDGFKPCSSPAKLKRLKRGKHKFSVRAIAGGVVDPTPAKTSFKVKAKHKKH